MLKLGLTGGIGSGKSTVAEMLRARGAFVIDADAESRALTAPGGEALPDIAQAFGSGVIGADAALDRSAMRERVFSDPRAKERLEAILHPLIAQHMATLAAKAAQCQAACVVYDIPLLLESGRWRTQLDRVLVVDCEPETQVQRVCHRNGLAVAAVQAIMATQIDRWSRLQGADDVLFNGAGVSLDDLRRELVLLAQRFGL